MQESENLPKFSLFGEFPQLKPNVQQIKTAWKQYMSKVCCNRRYANRMQKCDLCKKPLHFEISPRLIIEIESICSKATRFESEIDSYYENEIKREPIETFRDSSILSMHRNFKRYPRKIRMDSAVKEYFSLQIIQIRSEWYLSILEKMKTILENTNCEVDPTISELTDLIEYYSEKLEITKNRIEPDLLQYSKGLGSIIKQNLQLRKIERRSMIEAIIYEIEDVTNEIVVIFRYVYKNVDSNSNEDVNSHGEYDALLIALDKFYAQIRYLNRK